MRRLVLFALVFIIGSQLYAQQFTISGTVKDQQAGTSLQRATIRLYSSTNPGFSKTTLSDTAGYFIFQNLQRDSFEPDWTDCDMSGDPVFAAPVPPRRVTIYEEIDFWLVGLTFPTFWRPATATVRVGDRVEHGIHLLQLWMIRPMGGEEVLVVYPQDGYWRIRPKTPSGLDTTVFGSSFLIGPVEDEGRPVVRLEELAFDPETKTFTLTFERGGSATVQIVETDQNRHALHVVFDKPIEGRPFAAMRSMYVTEFNNDAARIALREPGAKGWREEPIMSFDRAMATDIWLGRLTPSRHNTSSPDMIFNSFSETTKPRLRRNEPPPEVEPKR